MNIVRSVALRLRLLPGAVLLAGLCVATTARADNAGIYNQTSFKTADGAAIFRSICQGCHMPDAHGAQGAGRYPALAGNPRIVSSRYMAAVIFYGRRNMPAFKPVAPDESMESRFLRGTSLSDAQIAEVVGYVRTHFGNHYADDLSATDVAALHDSP